jgi:hypothetical protein
MAIELKQRSPKARAVDAEIETEMEMEVDEDMRQHMNWFLKNV